MPRGNCSVYQQIFGRVAGLSFASLSWLIPGLWTSLFEFQLDVCLFFPQPAFVTIERDLQLFATFLFCIYFASSERLGETDDGKDEK